MEPAKRGSAGKIMDGQTDRNRDGQIKANHFLHQSSWKSRKQTIKLHESGSCLKNNTNE